MLVPDPAGPGGERVKLLDFGIAKLGAAHLQGEDVKTRTGQIMGTAAYMSPEQFGGHKPTDGQSDVYSLACLMFRLLSGQQPFVSDSGEMAVAAMHMFKPAPPLQTLVPEAAPWLVNLIDSMLRKEPDERPTMAEVAALLQEALPDYAVSRKSLPPFRLEVSGATRLRDLELGTPDRGTPDRGTPDRGRPSKPPPSELIAPTIDQPGASGVSSPSGSITGATGQAGPPASRRMGRGAMLLVTGLSLISAAGVGGLLAWHHQAAPPKAATVPSQPVPPTPVAAPTAPTAPPPTSPPATPAAVAAPSGSADKPTTATAAEPAVEANSESDPDQKTRRERAALKLGKPSKLGSHLDGRAKNKTPHATQIIN